MAETFRDLQSFFKTTLTSTITSSQSTIPVASAPTVTTGFLVIEPETTNQEIVLYTGLSGNTLTGVTRGLSPVGSSETTAGLGKAHSAGVEIAMVDVHYYLKLIQTKSTWKFRGAYVDTTAINAITNAELGDVAVEYTNKLWYLYNGSAWVTIEGSEDVELTGDQTVAGIKTWQDRQVFQSGFDANATSKVADPVDGDDIATKQFVLSVAFGASLIAGLDGIQINYDQNGRVRSVHDTQTAQTFVLIYDQNDNVEAVFDGTNTWVIRKTSDGKLQATIKH